MYPSLTASILTPAGRIELICRGVIGYQGSSPTVAVIGYHLTLATRVARRAAAGGAVAGGLADHRFPIQVMHEAAGGSTVVPAFSLQGMDFAFLLATVVGVYAMHRVSLDVEGETGTRSVVFRNLFEEVKRPVLTFSDGDQLAVIGVPLSVLRTTQRQVGRFNGLIDSDGYRFR